MTGYDPEDVKAAAVLLLRAMSAMRPGDTLESAMRAVLDRDQEITTTALADTEAGKTIRSELTRQVYETIRARRQKPAA